MNLVTGYFRELTRGAVSGWNRFWFSPADPATLGLVRILAGAMLFYTHLVWTLDLAGFFGSGHPWLSTDTIARHLNGVGSTGFIRRFYSGRSTWRHWPSSRF